MLSGRRFVSLNKRLLFSVLIVSTVTTTILTSFTLFFEYKNELELKKSELQPIETTFLKSISIAFWTLDDQQMKVQLEGLLKIPSVTRVFVTDIRGKVNYTVNKNIRVSTEEEIIFPLETDKISEKKIGTLHVLVTNDFIVERMRHRLISIALTQSVKTFLTSIILLIVFSHLITRHLIKITNHMNLLQTQKDFTDISISLDRGERSSTDELDSLVHSINSSTSQLMNANKENLKLNMELRQANEAKTLFLTNMSHELRTPLNALLGLTDVLLRSDLNVQDRKHLMVQEKMARHLLNTLNNVLDYSRMEAQELQIESKSFDLRAVIDQVCSEIKSQTDSKMNQFFCEIADDLPKWVRGDDERLSQVLLNILDNANKFTSYGRIVLSVKRLGNTYTFLVADTGEGIEESQLPYIFEPFFQGNKGHTKKYQGTGMGLTISQALVKMMGSEIKVHSEYAKGSQFWFELRLPEEDSSLKSLRNSKNFSFDTLAPKTVLLVDDTPENILLLEVYMKKCPYKIIVAENGIQAVELYKTHQIDVILMDLQMPLMNGYEATAHIRQFERDQRNDNHVLIIACTAYTGKTDVDLAYQCGCDAYLSKPLTWFRLIEMIENLWSNQPISTRVDP